MLLSHQVNAISTVQFINIGESMDITQNGVIYHKLPFIEP